MARVEYKLPPGGNNGLAIRYPGKGDTAYVGMCEIQVLDDTAKQYAKLDPRQYNGSAYGMVAAHRGYHAARRRVEFRGSDHQGLHHQGGTQRHAHPRLRPEQGHRVHGQVAPIRARTAQSGHFGFAGHNDPVAFRNIQIKKLDETKKPDTK